MISNDIKNEAINSMIERYKAHIKETRLTDELYKWELAQKFSGRPDIKAENFSEEIRSIDFKNLVYHNGIGVLRVLADAKPDELRTCFETLFDRNKDLQVRIEYFSKETLALYRIVEPQSAKLSHHQDERSMATYLAYYDSNTYPFYKNSFYRSYCKYLGIKPKSAPNCYVHYKELLDELIENYIKTDEELLELKAEFLIGDVHPDPNNYILAQDMLFEFFGRLMQLPSYWIFQGSPDIYDAVNAIKDGNLKSWKVAAHKAAITEGDKVILYLTGEKAGVYALAEVTSEVMITVEDPAELQYYKDPVSHDSSTERVELKIIYDMTTDPLLKSEMDKIKELKDLKVGNRGTNFSATKEEYEAILQNATISNERRYWLLSPGKNASLWEEFYEQGIAAIGWDELGDLNQYIDRDDLGESFNKTYPSTSSNNNNILANYEFWKTMRVGDIIIPKKGRGLYVGYGVVTSDYYFDEGRKQYKSCRKINWVKKGEWPDEDIVHKTLTDITKYPDYVDKLRKLIGIGMDEQPNTLKMTQSQNTILFGPPGTGKTYELKEHYFPLYTTSETAISLEQYTDGIMKNTTWWQAVAMVLYELKSANVTEIMNHPWMKQKAAHSTSKNIRAAIWAHLQIHTIENSTTVAYQNRNAPYIFDKLENSEWKIFDDLVQSDAPEIIELVESINNFKPNADNEVKRYVFTTFHQSFSYEDFIEGIKPVMDEGDNNGELRYEIKAGIFKQICRDAENDSENRYAIFIDEINRGNVSAIFGELITLIEADKRAGAENAMSVVLPYSKEDFSVPKNLDIYGTMNTADRSVESLDSALRRRFSFEEMRPKPALLAEISEKATNVSGIDLVQLLTTINERIELLLDKDHQIGHSYFIGIESLADLKNAFANKVIPLLEEYFFGDFGKIGLVLGEEFIQEVKSNEKVKFASNFKYEDENLLREKAVYKFTLADNWTAESFISIYTHTKND